MSYSYVIIDDDAAFTIMLQKKLETFPQLKYMHSFHDSVSSFIGIKDFNPDIIFLDINIDTFNGLELLNALPFKPTTIVVSGDAKMESDLPEEVCGFVHKPIKNLQKLQEVIDKATALVDETRQAAKTNS